MAAGRASLCKLPVLFVCAAAASGLFASFLPVGALALLGASAARGRVAAPAFLLEIAFSCGLGTLGTGGSFWLTPRAS